MTKKRVTTTLFIALVVLTLISCCFLGSTFARYVSGGNGSASTAVAKWDIDVTENGTEGNGEITWDKKLSPDMDAYVSNGQNRVNTLGEAVTVAVITNSGDVDAIVDFKIEKLTLNDSEPSYGAGLAIDENGWLTTAPTKDEVLQLFQMSLVFDHSVDEDRTLNVDNTNGSSATGIVLSPGESVTIKMTLAWQSADVWCYTNKASSNHDKAAQYSDALDTWAGENVTKLGWTFSYTAVQGSENPAA